MTVLPLPFQFGYILFFFTCPIAAVRTSNTVLNSSGIFLNMNLCGKGNNYPVTTIMKLKEENKKEYLKYYIPQCWVLKKLRVFLKGSHLLGGNERKEFI